MSDIRGPRGRENLTNETPRSGVIDPGDRDIGVAARMGMVFAESR